MQNKTSFKQELEKRQKSFLLIGMLVSLGLSLMAFEWASFDLQHMQVDKLEAEDLEPEPVLEAIKIEKPKPKRTARVKEKEFDPEKDETFKTKDDIDSLITNNKNLIIDTTIGIDDPIVDLGGDGPELPTGPWIIVEKMPSFPGGEKELYKYLGNNIKFTQCAIETGEQGKVYVQFVIEKDGSITNVTIPRGLGCGLNGVAEKAVKKMPRWTPGKQRGKKVRVRYTLPVQFKLR